jgi:hypothetical protein
MLSFAIVAASPLANPALDRRAGTPGESHDGSPDQDNCAAKSAGYPRLA